ncbi:MAG TPA: CYTH domain-containing protein [Kouleothrix sp.]|jgi:inorganic triphosphatase YgiF|nr:CYTH domain-containing protein [Kouleothrix sp.]
MEIEAKFKIADDTTFSELLQTSSLGAFTCISTPGIEYQQNTYFDTPDRQLHQRRYSLRVRDTGKRRIATVKHSLGGPAKLRRNEEWEVELTDGIHPHDWPASPARERALGLLGDAVLLPLLTIYTQRQFIYAMLGTTIVAELSLDQGTIHAGGRELDFRELEVELVGDGHYANLAALLEQLQARFALVHEPLGKKKRGMALLDGRLGTPRTLHQVPASTNLAKSALALALRMR